VKTVVIKYHEKTKPLEKQEEKKIKMPADKKKNGTHRR
jgi:hypothetical protein